MRLSAVFCTKMSVEIKVETLGNSEHNENTMKLATLMTTKAPVMVTPTTQILDKSFLCHICSKCFRHKHHLLLHLKVHSNEKEYQCTSCGRRFRQNSHLKQHSKIHTGKKEFSCEYCPLPKLFLHRGDLKRHLKTHRAQLPFQCSFCAVRFPDCIEQQSHEESCNSRRFKCSICEFETIDVNALNRHKQVHMGERRYKCDLCAKAFRMKQHLNVHLKTHVQNKVKNIKCNVCNKVFSLKSHLVMHMKYHTGDRAFPCELCSKCFVHKGDLNRHRKVHGQIDQTIKSEKCVSGKTRIIDESIKPPSFFEVIVKEEPITETELLINHSYRDSGSGQFDDDDDANDIIDSQYDTLIEDINKPNSIIKPDKEAADVQYEQICTIKRGKVRKNRAYSIRKKRKSKVASPSFVKSSQCQSQDERKQFFCDICSKGFRLKHHLVIHIRTHTGQKDYQCEVCSKNFAQISHLNLHLKTHSGEKRFPCAHCEKRFLHRGDLHRHLRTHRELPFSCGFCSRRFSDETTKVAHEKTCTCHVHRCSLCTYTTAVSTRFKTHMIVHTGQKDFQCDICSKKFAYKQNLDNHLKIHSNERSFQCDRCFKSFRLKVHLQRHSKLHKRFTSISTELPNDSEI